MVIEKERFFEQLRNNPENAIRLLRIVSKRFGSQGRRPQEHKAGAGFKRNFTAET